MQLEFEVKNQTVKLLGDYELVKGSKNYLVAHFTFSEDWQDVSKKMIYFSKNSPDKEIFVGTTADGGTKIGYELDSNNSVLIPPEFIQKSGFIVNLTGLNSDKQEVITTNPATVYVTDNGLLTDETEGKTLPEYLEEKLVVINKAVIDSEEQAEAAANSAGKAEAAKTAAQKAQQAAETAKDTAGDEAQNAANSAELAQKWAESNTSPDGEPDSKSAKTWAEEASASASAASTSKTQAATSASNAASCASAAAGSATSASGSASTATQKAQEAANSANTASTAASTATSKASEAATSASTATSKAQAASESAQDAADSAGDAADSASAAESSKTAAAQSANAAAQSASEAGNAATEAVGNPVTSVTKDGNNIKVQKKDGTSNEIPLPTVPGVASQSEAEAGTENTKIMTPLRTKQAIAAQAVKTLDGIAPAADGTINMRNWLYRYPSSDFEDGLTTAEWNTKGIYATFFNNSEEFPQKPTTYALLLNLASSSSNGHAVQLAFNVVNGEVYTRGTNNQVELDNVPFKRLRYENEETTAYQRNGIYRGKNLGTITSANIASFLSEHEVSAGKFTDLYIGDEITIQDGTYNAKWLIAGFDTEYNKGDTAFTTHHITLIPKTPLYDAAMNSTDTTVGGYKGSAMHTSEMPSLNTKLQNALGTHLLSHRAIVSNAVNTTAASGGLSSWTGAASGWEWVDVKAVLPTEAQIYGGKVFGSSGYDAGEAKQKLPIFNFINSVQFSRWSFWLRSVASDTHFCFCSSLGYAFTVGASNSFGVRPLICVG